MVKRILGIVIISLQIIHAQEIQTEKTSLEFIPTYSKKNYSLNDSILLENKNLTLSVFKFYVSNIKFIKGNQTVWEENNSYHLIEMNTDKHSKLSFDLPTYLKYDQIQFQLGIDSLTNVSGAMGGDLDPTKGMYWTWQSGYINVKMEGYCSTCNTRNHQFEFHLGGYLPPFQSIQTILLPLTKSKKIEIGVDFINLLNSIELSKECNIMSPGQKAKNMSEKAATMFYILSNE
jgi:hypothetical protein